MYRPLAGTPVSVSPPPNVFKAKSRSYHHGPRQAELDFAVKRLVGNVLGVQGDVSNLEDLDRLYATIRKQKGHLDILFANVGGGSFAPLGGRLHISQPEDVEAN
jgi:NAD(P)-dependent dehydrogenase (short-subunit alcohol dehydrogenase family)